ncbi:MAG: hypothetical protein ACM3QS_04485 [Bacteroidota bacterium]
MKTRFFFILSAALLLSACGTLEVSMQQTPQDAPPAASAAPSPIPATPEAVQRTILVAYVKEGNVYLWDEATGQSRAVFTSGDADSVTLSDDGRVIAFSRRSFRDQPEPREDHALWAVDQDGRNPRELVAADELRRRLNTPEQDSTGFDELKWVPGTHRLVYTASSYYLPGQAFSLSPDVYLVDADTRADGVLAPAAVGDPTASVLLIPSPDGRQLAILSNTILSLINMDGSDWRPSVQTYAAVSRGDSHGVLVRGVWTQDSSAFLVTGPTSLDPYNDIDFTIWRVPADGSAPESLASVAKSHPGSVTFSPDGRYFAYVQYGDEQLEPLGWFISPFPGSVGPLAISHLIDLTGYTSLHWSPAGDAFTRDLIKLCPRATKDTDGCDAPLSFFGGPIGALQWMDGSRLIYLGRDAPVLYLGSLDGKATPIVTWSQPDISHSFSAAFASQ